MSGGGTLPGVFRGVLSSGALGWSVGSVPGWLGSPTFPKSATKTSVGWIIVVLAGASEDSSTETASPALPQPGYSSPAVSIEDRNYQPHLSQEE